MGVNDKSMSTGGFTLMDVTPVSGGRISSSNIEPLHCNEFWCFYPKPLALNSSYTFYQSMLFNSGLSEKCSCENISEKWYYVAFCSFHDAFNMKYSVAQKCVQFYPKQKNVNLAKKKVLAHCSFAISKMSCRTRGKIVRITCCRYTWQNWSIQAKTGLVCELRTLPLTNELSSGKHMLSSNTQSSHFSMPITNESDILWNEERQKMNGILLLGPGLFFCHRKEIK